LLDFEVGKVADRDVVAEQAVLYEDVHATGLRREAQERLVPAVYHYSYRATEELRNRWSRFAALAETRSGDVLSREAYSLELQSELPGEFQDDVLALLYQSQTRETILMDFAAILDTILERGIYSVPDTGTENLNPDVVELVRQAYSRIEMERIPLWSIVTREKVPEAIEALTVNASRVPSFAETALSLLKPFLKENVFYSPEDTARRVSEAR
jgi:membrane-associated HD superfamily phosphohydrolase